MFLSKTTTFLFFVLSVSLAFPLGEAESDPEKVRIRTYSGKYIRAYPGGSAIVDQADEASAWEHFTIVRFPDEGKVALHTHHGTYLRAHENGSVDTAGGLGTWEKFDLISAGTKNALKTFHGNYLSAIAGPDAVITGGRDRMDDSELFEFESD